MPPCRCGFSEKHKIIFLKIFRKTLPADNVGDVQIARYLNTPEIKASQWKSRFPAKWIGETYLVFHNKTMAAAKLVPEPPRSPHALPV